MADNRREHISLEEARSIDDALDALQYTSHVVEILDIASYEGILYVFLKTDLDNESSINELELFIKNKLSTLTDFDVRVGLMKKKK